LTPTCLKRLVLYAAFLSVVAMLGASASACAYALLLWQTSSTSAGGPTPPVWPSGFSIEFSEQLNATSSPTSTVNTGRWLYDWANRRSRFDHDAGQRNDFCQLALGHTAVGEVAPACRLYFTEQLEMWVAYPDSKDCCSMCSPNPHGFPAVCSTLLPDWLAQNSTYRGQVTIDGQSCSWWSKPGAVADDNWYARADGTPCAYMEHYRASGANIDNITDHAIHFDAASYVVGSPPPADFVLPSYCNRNCSFPFASDGLHSSLGFEVATMMHSLAPIMI